MTNLIYVTSTRLLPISHYVESSYNQAYTSVPSPDGDEIFESTLSSPSSVTSAASELPSPLMVICCDVYPSRVETVRLKRRSKGAFLRFVVIIFGFRLDSKRDLIRYSLPFKLLVSLTFVRQSPHPCIN